MSSISGVTPASQSLLNVWNRVGQKSEELATQVANGDLDAASFVQTAVALQTLKIQAAAASLVFQSLNDVAGELLTQPRK